MTRDGSQPQSPDLGVLDHESAIKWAQSRRKVPAWVLSMVVHALLSVCLFFGVRTISKGITDEPARRGSIALAQRSTDQTDYIDGDSQQQATGNPSENDLPPSQSLESALPSLDMPPADIGSLLPVGDSSASAASVAATGLPTAGGLTQGGATSKGGLGEDGTTSVFGAEGKGTKFVYVFDRSGSMQGYGGRPLAASKQELVKSLNDLGDLHQFAIIFYNENTHVFSPKGRGAELIFADEQGTRLAERFVRSVVAGGGTQHMDALMLAINMRPDVIFFLTDAAQPQLFPDELEKIRRRNNGATIHTIEFGHGPYNGERNFLVKLAEQNDGRHVYVDISRLTVRPGF